MKMSQYFVETLREAPTDIQFESQQYLLRAGYFRPLAAGIYTYLPLGLRSLKKIEGIIRFEMDKIGALEISMPIVQPAELWKESGRWFKIDAELARFNDRNDREMVLGMTHEEVLADLSRKMIHSYRQLPTLVYQIQLKFRDDPRPRGGLIRAREFTMKDGYSMDTSFEGLDRQYRSNYQAYFNIFQRCGLEVVAVKSDSGIMGGSLAHEYMVLNSIGEDAILLCSRCQYSANRQVATFFKSPGNYESPLEIERVSTPECKTIAELADFLGIPTSKTAKAVFFIATTQTGLETREQFVFAVIRGDMEINETKLSRTIGADQLRPANEAEIKAVGAEPGYASPVGLSNILTVVDEIIPKSSNLVAGANMEGFHLRNVNYPRDFSADIIADIAAAQDNDLCIQCKSPLKMERAVEVAHIYKLDSDFSDTMGCSFQDESGEVKPIIMGSYGIGVGRLLATIAEKYHDERGLILPITIAPFQVHLINLHSRKGADFSQISEKIYRELESAGIEVLYDDREESAGVKFMDADLIGLPMRLTVSERSIQSGGVELKLRTKSDKEIFPIESITDVALSMITRLTVEIEDSLEAVPYYE